MVISVFYSFYSIHFNEKICLIPLKQLVVAFSHMEYVQSVFIGRALICSTNSLHGHIEWYMHTDQPYSPSRLIQLSNACTASSIMSVALADISTWGCNVLLCPSPFLLNHSISLKKWLKGRRCTLHSP